MKFWTKSQGTGGKIYAEEDFVVEEIPSRKYFAKFVRSGSGIKTIEGPYTLCLLTKKGIATKEALGIISRELGIGTDDIGYAGLKDKFATTTQYITIKGRAKEITRENIQLKIIGFTDKKMQVGDLEGNKFTIILRNCRNPGNVSVLVKELSARGMPNYFGQQRFGKHGDNHKVGKLVLQRNFSKALSMVNSHGRNYTSIRSVEKRTLKFYIHSYQSYLFNKLLDRYISLKSVPLFAKFPIVGYNTKLKKDFACKEMAKIMKKEGIRTEDFSIRELGIRCNGSSRDAFVMPKDMSYEIDGKTLVLHFSLPKGSYATVLIREISKISKLKDPKA